MTNAIPTVLFVCNHNSARSQMAESFMSRLSRDRGLSVRIRSAGTRPTAKINPIAQKVMEEIGISMEGRRPKMISQDLVDMADIIITMGCTVDNDVCPSGFHVDEDWGLDDPAGQPIERVREIRDTIRSRVDNLLDAMADGKYVMRQSRTGARKG